MMRVGSKLVLTGSLLCGLMLPAAAMAQTDRMHTTAPAPVPAVPPPSNATSGLSATTPAPVPNIPAEQVAPSDRIPGAGPGGQSHAAGPADGTPFSAAPSTDQPSDNRAGSHSRSDSGANSVDSPNLSK